MGLTIIGAGEKLPAAVPPPLRYSDGRLVVYGMRTADTYYHVARRGSWDAPQDNSGKALVVAKSLCGHWITANGYCYDHGFPAGFICPACTERL